MTAPAQQQYWDQVHADVLAAAQRRGVAHPEVVARLGAAQSCLETGYGVHSVGGNYFGIKAATGEQGVTATTKEFVGGQYVTVDAEFAAYDSPRASALAYVDFLLRHPRYSAVLAAETDEAAIAAIAASGYATAPTYGDVLRAIMAAHPPAAPKIILPEPPASAREPVASTPWRDRMVADSRSLQDLIDGTKRSDPELWHRLSDKPLAMSRTVWGSFASMAVSWAVTRYGLQLDSDTCALISGAIVLGVTTILRRYSVGGISGIIKATPP